MDSVLHAFRDELIKTAAVTDMIAKVMAPQAGAADEAHKRTERAPATLKAWKQLGTASDPYRESKGPAMNAGLSPSPNVSPEMPTNFAGGVASR